MIAYVESACIQGVQGVLVKVETDIVNGLPYVELVGLYGKVANEAKERVRSAVRNTGFSFPMQRIVINVSPAELKKEGSHFDLPIAMGILAASNQIPWGISGKNPYVFLGALALDGSVESVKGVLPMVLEAARRGASGVVLPKDNVSEALAVKGIRVVGVSHLREAVIFAADPKQRVFDCIPSAESEETGEGKSRLLDFSDIKGQEYAKRALEIAAAGNHACLLVGSPGSGKTALAKRIPTILPEMDSREALETTVIYSISGRMDPAWGMMRQRPFRSPHHSVTAAALIGGGRIPEPGEVSLAHNGVLFLDEINEMQPTVLEQLREPLEEHIVRISRKEGTFVYPANFLLIAAANPCKCGMLLEKRHPCTCTPREIARYGNQLSGAMLDRIELKVEVQSSEIHTLQQTEKGESSEVIRARVQQAREIQRRRFSREKFLYNSQMTHAMLEKYVPLDQTSVTMLQKFEQNFIFSPRGYLNVLRVARTIADLAGSEVTAQHIAEALQYRMTEQGGN